jgi:hypothetical protein
MGAYSEPSKHNPRDPYNVYPNPQTGDPYSAGMALHGGRNPFDNQNIYPLAPKPVNFYPRYQQGYGEETETEDDTETDDDTDDDTEDEAEAKKRRVQNKKTQRQKSGADKKKKAPSRKSRGS